MKRIDDRVLAYFSQYVRGIPFFRPTRQVGDGWWEASWTVTWAGDLDCFDLAKRFSLPLPPETITDMRFICAVLPDTPKSRRIAVLSRRAQLKEVEIVYAALVMKTIEAVPGIGEISVDGIVRHPILHVLGPLPAWVTELDHSDSG